MSDFAGFVDADDYSGDPVYVDVTVTSEGSFRSTTRVRRRNSPRMR